MENTSNKHTHAGHRGRLRERFARAGFDGFSEHEILELLLTYAIPRVNVNDQAHALIDRFGSLAGVLDARADELVTVPGIGPEAARFLKLLPATYRHYAIERCEVKERMDSVEDIVAYMRAVYTGATNEQVYMLLFDAGMHMTDCIYICEGHTAAASVNIQKIAEMAFSRHAAAVVLTHNHPKGMPLPSLADYDTTETIRQALELLGIPLLEHIIVTDNSHGTIMHRGRTELSVDTTRGRR